MQAGEHGSFRKRESTSAGGGGAFEQGSMVVLERGGPLQLEEGYVFNRGRQLRPQIARSAAPPIPTMHPDSGIGNRNETKSHMIWAAHACTCDYHMTCIAESLHNTHMHDDLLCPWVLR